ncbi:hypothetical protein [Joostella sp. CR20]|uniref:hypothetical protein n=1 Tax=Joostella sp. CR20 TaxID=2804312 RepID=UPI00313EE018
MKITLTDYIKKRNGVAIGSSKSLRNNLYRSLGSKNFSTFWNYWNPIFGFYLGKYVFKPLKLFFPVTIAFLLTFVFCGMIHDIVTTLVRGRTSFFFSIWFFLMGMAVLVTKLFNHNFSRYKWITRAVINLTIISLCLLLTLLIKEYF